MSPAAPLIQPSDATRVSSRVDALPPWLLSTIFHMVAVIALGVLHISTTPGRNLHLLFVPTENVADFEEADTTGLSDLDIQIEAEPMPVQALDETASPLLNEDMLASLEADWSDIPAFDGGAVSPASGLGEGTISEMAGGDKGYASLFGLSGEGGKFVYVFDRSESMNSIFTLYSEGRIVSMITPLVSAKQELVRSLNSLSQANEFQIVFYNNAPYIFGESHYSDRLYKADEENKLLARGVIEQMPGKGFTNHLSALELAFTLDPDVVFLLTDAEAKDDLHPSVVRRMYKYCQRRNIVVNVVHFCRVPRPECTLIDLAEKTGGEHLFISLESLAESMIEPADF